MSFINLDELNFFDDERIQALMDNELEGHSYNDLDQIIKDKGPEYETILLPYLNFYPRLNYHRKEFLSKCNYISSRFFKWKIWKDEGEHTQISLANIYEVSELLKSEVNLITDRLVRILFYNRHERSHPSYLLRLKNDERQSHIKYTVEEVDSMLYYIAEQHEGDKEWSAYTEELLKVFQEALLSYISFYCVCCGFNKKKSQPIREMFRFKALR